MREGEIDGGYRKAPRLFFLDKSFVTPALGMNVLHVRTRRQWTPSVWQKQASSKTDFDHLSRPGIQLGYPSLEKQVKLRRKTQRDRR